MMRVISRIRGAALLGTLLPGLLVAAAACSSEEPNPPPNQGNGGMGPIGRGGDGGTGGTGAGGTGGEGGSAGSGGSGGSIGIPLRIENVRPPRGSLAGGETVIINGSGFVRSLAQDARPTDVTTVTFGSNPAVGARVIDDDTIIAPTPPGTEGNVDVTISNPSGEVVCSGCYRYQAPVVLSSVEPAEGSIRGGSVVTLRGQNIRPTMTVLFGGRAAIDVQAEADGSLTAIVPPGDVQGAVDVRIFDADGQAVIRRGFIYRDTLRITSVEPPGGPMVGGNQVVITGTGFTNDAEVLVGGVPAVSTLDATGHLVFSAPAGSAAGPATLEVRTPAGTVSSAYAYFDPNAAGVNLYLVSPARGSLEGGEAVTLVGTGLDSGNLAVRFGSELASASVVNGNFVTATVPAGASAGTVDVSVRATAGAALLADGYRYVQTVALASVTPASGPLAGGTTITLRGSGFPAAPRVFVGALEATAVERLDATTLRAVTPRGSDGAVPVRVIDPADPDNEAVLAGGFSYEGPFSVARLDPNTGARAGGTRTILRGAGFRPGLSVLFGANLSLNVSIQDPFTAIVAAPRGDVGTVDVSVDSGAGNTALLEGAFTYFDPTSLSGGSSGGPLNGTLNVTVLDGGRARGGLPLAGATVILGSEDSTTLQGLTDDRGQITFSDPALVKAQVVSVALDAYQTTTVVNQASENLTVYMIPNFEPAECANDIDDDGDGLLDFDGNGDSSKIDQDGCHCGPANSPMPELCACPMMPQEQATCCDGIDNDGDGDIDANDEDCQCSGGSSEGPLAACSNCKDDDGDGGMDWMPPPGRAPDIGCANPGDNDERGVIVAGRVWGFKLPGGRVLGPSEQEVAFVRISVPSVYHAPPWAGSLGPQFMVARDGGSFAFEFASARYMAVYAVYGILNNDTAEFEPLLMGVRRGVNPTTGGDITSADIVLDMHLNKTVPVTVDNPPVLAMARGSSEIFAYMDLGLEGVIPLGSALTDDEPTHATLEHLPAVSGENVIFHLWGGLIPGTVPLTATFRRQAGDITQGVTMGPLMGLTRMVQPTGQFQGTIEWLHEAGPEPEVAQVQIDEPTLAGPIPQWHMVVPGSERRITVPPSVLQRLRNKYPPGTTLQLTLITAREPRFSYDQWNYTNLDVPAFTSFTWDVVGLQL